MSVDRSWRSKERLRNLYVEERLTTAEIGERLGCSRRTVENWIARYELTSEAKPWRDKQTLERLRDNGLSEADIGDELGCSQATVHNWLERFKLDTDRIKPEFPWHDESVLRRLYLDRKLTMAEVADELDCSRQAIEKWIHQYGIETRSRNPDPPDELREEETLRELYQQDGLSTYEISEQFNCAPSAVFSWLKRHDIGTRSVGSQPGELHHRWKGGVDPYYGPNWTETREEVLERDGRECIRCGVSNETHKDRYDCGLDIHHEIPIREFSDVSEANDLDNLVTLCRKCHNRIEPPQLTNND